MQSQANRRVSGAWDDILVHAAAIVTSYDTGVTLRQLFYRLVSDGTIRNTRAEYSQLSSRTAVARREGWFPDLVDRTRQIVVPAAWASPQAAKEALREQYRRDRTEGQPYTVYLGVEKAGIVEQLRSWFDVPLGVPILPLGGYHSETFEREVRDHAGRYERPSVLLYAGDLDASGEDIERNFLRHTGFAVSRKVALTLEQAVEHDLPPLPGKAKDQRARAFIEKYGTLFQIELDALPPDVLRGLFATALEEFWDDRVYRAVVEREEAERGEL